MRSEISISVYLIQTFPPSPFLKLDINSNTNVASVIYVANVQIQPWGFISYIPTAIGALDIIFLLFCLSL